MTAAEEDTPQPAHSPLTGVTVGGTITLAGVVAVSSALTSSMARDGASVHGAAMFLSSVAIIVGLLVVAVVLLDWRNARRDAERARVAALRTTAVKDLLTEIKEGFAQVAAARTVDLAKVEQQLTECFHVLNEQAMLGQVMIAEKFSAKITNQLAKDAAVAAGAVAELGERFKDLEADVASFRLGQKQMQSDQAKVNGNGRASILRALPTQPD